MRCVFFESQRGSIGRKLSQSSNNHVRTLSIRSEAELNPSGGISEKQLLTRASGLYKKLFGSSAAGSLEDLVNCDDVPGLIILVNILVGYFHEISLMWVKFICSKRSEINLSV